LTSVVRASARFVTEAMPFTMPVRMPERRPVPDSRPHRSSPTKPAAPCTSSYCCIVKCVKQRDV
jgi:hypothetical protein